MTTEVKKIMAEVRARDKAIEAKTPIGSVSRPLKNDARPAR